MVFKIAVPNHSSEEHASSSGFRQASFCSLALEKVVRRISKQL